MRANALLVLAVAVGLCAAPALGDPPPYRLDWLGGNFFPFAINDHGQVVGLDLLGHGYGPALLWEQGATKELGEGQGNDINNAGTIVLGMPISGRGQPGAVVLSPDGTRIDVGLPEGWGGDFRHEFSINNHGQVVGMRKNEENSDGRAFLWDNGVVKYLDLGVPVQLSSAHDINDSGQVVGWWSGADNVSGGGFLWHDGATTLLPFAAVSINERTQVLLNNGEIWKNGATTPVPSLPPLPTDDPRVGPYLNVREINDAGAVVGWLQEFYLIDEEHGDGSFNRGFLWDPTLGVIDLNAIMGFGPVDPTEGPFTFALAEPVDINNAGQIIGWGPGGGWLLTPVPEPGGIQVILGTIALRWTRRRRKRRWN